MREAFSPTDFVKCYNENIKSRKKSMDRWCETKPMQFISRERAHPPTHPLALVHTYTRTDTYTCIHTRTHTHVHTHTRAHARASASASTHFDGLFHATYTVSFEFD